LWTAVNAGKAAEERPQGAKVMAEKVSFNVDLSGLANYTPVEGIGSSSLLKMDGFYAATITKVLMGKSSSGNNKFIVGLAVQDADEKGATLIADVLVSGQDKNGNPNIRQLGDLLNSLGMTMEQVRGFAANGTQPGEGLAQTLTGKTVYCNVEAETYNNDTRSRVRGYITQQRYADAVSANAHRKVRKAEQAFSSAPAGAQTAAPALNVTTPTASVNGASNAAVDPLAKLKSLNLPV
jgi:hypothetical protein